MHSVRDVLAIGFDGAGDVPLRVVVAAALPHCGDRGSRSTGAGLGGSDVACTTTERSVQAVVFSARSADVLLCGLRF